MPWMQRLTWSGTALHAGVVPGYPASHGCIRLPYSFAPKLFSMTTVGAQVVVAHDSVAPKLIEHAALLQPLPPPTPPSLVRQETGPKTDAPVEQRSRTPSFGSGLPVVLAKAEVGSVRDRCTGSGSGLRARGRRAEEAIMPPWWRDRLRCKLSAAAATPNDDTRVHAIDPTAGPFVGSGAACHRREAVGEGQAAKCRQGGAAVEASDDVSKHQDRLAPAFRSPPAGRRSATPVRVATKGPSHRRAPSPKRGPILTVSAIAIGPAGA